jgi:hypothetical protein
MLEKLQPSPALLRELAEDNPLGITLTPEEVMGWVQYVCWPRFKTYKYQQRTRAMKRWWASVRMEDIQRARDAMGRAALERLQAKQDEISRAPMPDVPLPAALRILSGGKA